MSIRSKIIKRVEKKRHCGYRVEGGEYLIGDGRHISCHKLPMTTLCHCCNEEIPFTRSFVWVWSHRFVSLPCPSQQKCQNCYPVQDMKAKVLVMWVGETHYKTVDDFCQEAALQGVSKRIPFLPNNFIVGETWVFLAHRHAIKTGNKVLGKKEVYSKNAPIKVLDNQWQHAHFAPANTHLGTFKKLHNDGEKNFLIISAPNKHKYIVREADVEIRQKTEPVYAPGIFYVFRPTAIEYIVKGDETDEQLEELHKRGFDLIQVIREAVPRRDDFEKQKQLEIQHAHSPL